MNMGWGLSLAAVGAILGWSRNDFARGFSDPKMLLIVAGVVGALLWARPARGPGRYGRAASWYGLSWLPSLAASRDLWRSLFGAPSLYTGGALAAGLGAAGLLLAERLREAEKVSVRRWILWAGVLTAVLCLAQKAGVDPFRFVLPQGRAVGLLGSHVDAGALFVAVLAVSPWSLVPLLLAGLLVTGSRGAMLAAVVSLLPVRARAGAAAVAVVLGMAYVIGSPNLSPSDLGRRELWSVAVKNVSIWGTGPGTFRETFEAGKSAAFANYRQAFAHNAILDAVNTRGVFGVLGLLSFLVAPRMAGIWVVSMFNPISFEVAFLACVLTGLYPAEHERTWV